MFSPTTHPRWRAPWGLLVFLLAYLILIAVVSRYYLLPALEVIRNATPAERRLLNATSLLLLAVVLFVIGVGVVLTFRVSRFFFPRPTAAGRSRTQYIDAWAESSKRLQVEPEEDAEEDAEES